MIKNNVIEELARRRNTPIIKSSKEIVKENQTLQEKLTDANRLIKLSVKNKKISSKSELALMLPRLPKGTLFINLTGKIFKLEEESEPAVLNQNGLYVIPPTGTRIINGHQKAFVYVDLIDITYPLYLLSGNLCYGIIKLSKPKKISLKEFQKLFELHKISEPEREKLWPDTKIFYIYPITIVRKWSPPRAWKTQKGKQTIIKDVKFSHDMKDLNNDINLIFEEATRTENVSKELKKSDYYMIKRPDRTMQYVAQHHHRGDSIHTDLRFEVNDHLIGITLDTPGNKNQHDKFLEPISASQGKDYQMLSELKLIQPKAWLKVKGNIPAGGIGATRWKDASFDIVSHGKVKFGTQKSDFHEYFLEPDSSLNQDSTVKGRWILAYIPKPKEYSKAGKDNMMWTFFKPNDQKPYVETHNFEEEKQKAIHEKINMIWQHPDKEDIQIINGATGNT